MTSLTPQDAHDQFLEDAREQVFATKAVILQRHLRGAMARKRFAQMKSAMIVIQQQWRAMVTRQRYEVLSKGFGRLQALVISHALTPQFKNTRKVMVNLQCYIRGYNARRAFRQLAANVQKVQGIFRMLLACAQVHC